ncbi:MAG: AMP-dependent synthetase/ligase [Solirubrobacterales bacterium]
MESGTVERREDAVYGGDLNEVEAKTMAQALENTIRDNGDTVAVRTKDDEVSLTWSELGERIDALAGGLAKLGLEKGDRMAILLGNRPEFHLVDLAAMSLGATTLSIYETYAAGQIEYVCGDAGVEIAVIEKQFADTFLEARTNLPDIKHVVVIDSDEFDDTTTLDEVEGSNPDFDVQAARDAITPEDVLTLIYTSGTTGKPKGVQLSHANLIAAVRSFDTIIDFPENAKVISWLPAAHIAERAAHHYLPTAFGFTVTTCPDAKQIGDYLAAVRPTWFFAVPRIWEKIKAKLESMAEGADEETKQKMQGAIEAGRKKVRLEQEGKEVPEELAQACQQAEENMFAGIRQQLGLDQIEAVHVGAAPTPAETLEFFHAIGIPVAELWGMSETCGSGCVNPPEKIKIGTVGPPAPGVEVKLGEGGELLVKADVVMLGYRGMEDKTRETMTDDGWLKTGDVAEIDDDGYVKIVDRMKEIIINEAGKNMSPTEIEAEIKSADSLIGQTAVIGDGRKYITALIVLDPDNAPAWADRQGLDASSLEEIAQTDEAYEAIGDAIEKANAKLARVEQVKYFHIVNGDWEPGGDELTPTMKLKRKPIAEKYEEQIEQMYEKEENV